MNCIKTAWGCISLRYRPFEKMKNLKELNLCPFTNIMTHDLKHNTIALDHHLTFINNFCFLRYLPEYNLICSKTSVKGIFLVDNLWLLFWITSAALKINNLILTLLANYFVCYIGFSQWQGLLQGMSASVQIFIDLWVSPYVWYKR